MDPASLDSNDIVVTGPHGFKRNAIFFSESSSDNGSTVVATYGVKSATGTWNASGDGIYSLELNAGQVANDIDDSAAAAALGAFSVRI